MNSIVALALAKKFTSSSIAGLGALRGSPCKVKSIQPVYSTEDPTVVVKNIVTLQWDSNESRDPSAPPMYHEETVEMLDNGRGVYDIEYIPEQSTAAQNWYRITFYDGTTDEFYIPASSGSMKKKVVAVLPSADLADKNTIYLVPIPNAINEYQQWLVVENDATGVWEWLSLGTTSVNLDDYQFKVDENITKQYPNYDPATKGTLPLAKNVVGAINEFDKVLGATYNYTTNEITNLTTKDKSTVVDVLNELGDITNAEGYDPVNRSTFVALINAANSEFTLDQGTVDRTKYIDVINPKRDAKDGSAKSDAGLPVKIPRVDVVQKTIPETNDYRTYDLKVGDALYDVLDSTEKPFGNIKIPTIKIKKNDPPEMTTTDVTTVDTWTSDGAGHFVANITLEHNPINTETVTASASPSAAGATFEVNLIANSVSATAIATGANPGGVALTYTFLCENPVLAAEYYLEIEGKEYSEAVSGKKIEISKSMVLKSGSVKQCTQDGVPLPNLLIGDLYIDLEFSTGPVAQHAYVAIKDMFKPYEGQESIIIEYDSANEVNKVKLIINDPNNTGALVQSDDGLQILEATETQKGIVSRATEDEVIAATDSVKYVSALELKTFAVSSDSIKNDLGNLARDASDNIINNTIVKAINEVASTRVAKQDTPDDGDIETYVVHTHPTDTTWETLGEKIHINQVIHQVDSLSGVVNKKDYELYYLTDLEMVGSVEYKRGLYVWNKTASKWEEAASSNGILLVDELPTQHINEQSFYLVPDDRTITGRYTLSDEAIASGYSMNKDGIDLVFPAQHWSWNNIQADWANWIGDELIEDANGAVCLLSDGSIKWNYVVENHHLYYFYVDRWIEAPVIQPIDETFIASLETID